jgi:hypothetical protein
MKYRISDIFIKDTLCYLVGIPTPDAHFTTDVSITINGIPGHYSGQILWKEQVPHGIGVFECDAYTYIGEFRKGNPHGECSVWWHQSGTISNTTDNSCWQYHGVLFNGTADDGVLISGESIRMADRTELDTMVPLQMWPILREVNRVYKKTDISEDVVIDIRKVIKSVCENLKKPLTDFIQNTYQNAPLAWWNKHNAAKKIMFIPFELCVTGVRVEMAKQNVSWEARKIFDDIIVKAKIVMYSKYVALDNVYVLHQIPSTVPPTMKPKAHRLIRPRTVRMKSLNEKSLRKYRRKQTEPRRSPQN